MDYWNLPSKMCGSMTIHLLFAIGLDTANIDTGGFIFKLDSPPPRQLVPLAYYWAIFSPHCYWPIRLLL